MNKIRRITASVVLASMFLVNIPLTNAEWTHNNEVLHHNFPLLMSKKERSATKDKQLCKIATSFDILNEDGTVKYTYYPQGCQPKAEINNFNYNYDDIDSDSNNQNEVGVDGFIKGLFGDGNEKIDTVKEISIPKKTNKIDNVKSMDFIDNLFGDTSKLSEDDIEFSSASEEPDDTTTTDESNQDADSILKEIFSTGYKQNKPLKGAKFIKTLKDYSEDKVIIRVGNVEANVLSNDMDYNSKVANLLKEIDEDFKINSFKNDFAKKIGNISYSLSIYNNTTDLETKKVFRNKLINDMKKLQKSYKVLKKKDRIISKFFEKRAQL